MELGFGFFFNSVLLGVGLAMDAFSVSLANGLNEPCMRKRRMCVIAGVFAFFQALMPMLGWVCVHTIAQYFRAFEKLIPWIALILLCWIGGGMIRDMMSSTTPAIFRKHIYALASIIGAIVYYLLMGMNRGVAIVVTTILVTVLRVLATVYRWSLPKIHWTQES